MLHLQICWWGYSQGTIKLHPQIVTSVVELFISTKQKDSPFSTGICKQMFLFVLPLVGGKQNPCCVLPVKIRIKIGW